MTTKSQTLVAATDGSVPDQVKASFGWILATTDGTRLAHCMGPAAYGYSIASYRAEGYGLLSYVIVGNNLKNAECAILYGRETLLHKESNGQNTLK